jgi:hypothetical protein
MTQRPMKTRNRGYGGNFDMKKPKRGIVKESPWRETRIAFGIGIVAVLLVVMFASCTTVQRGKIIDLIDGLKPDATATPEPGATPTPSPSDDLPAGITWLHGNVSSWPVTATLNASVTGNRITLDYDKANVWPGRDEAGTNVNANPWVIAEINGQWYAGTWEWLRTGQTVKNNVVRGDHVKRAPMSGDWKPKSGQRIGLMVSGLIRGSTRNVSERSNVVWVEWP